MRLIDYFMANDDRPLINKPTGYFDVYENYFHPFVNEQVKVLEIGVGHGGSLKMWKEYFGHECEIIGIDINPKCQSFVEDRIRIYTGDQADASFLNEVGDAENRFDIIIDDGGHRMEQQITSFIHLFPYLRIGGIYLCEDTGTSYWNEYGGGMKHPGSFIEYAKNKIDDLNYSSMPFKDNIGAIHFYQNIVVFEKQHWNVSETLAIGKLTL